MGSCPAEWEWEVRVSYRIFRRGGGGDHLPPYYQCFDTPLEKIYVFFDRGRGGGGKVEVPRLPTPV